MLVTKNAVELFALLVNDLFGELPSRIFESLLRRGRSNVSQLAHSTSIGPRALRHGLAVLIQQGLVFHSLSTDSVRTSYEANSQACYNLIRSGKILRMINVKYGSAEKELVQTLLLVGHARISDLIHAFVVRGSKSNGSLPNGHGLAASVIHSEKHLLTILSRLIQADIIEAVRPDSFRSPAEVFHEIEAEVTKPGIGEKASRNKIEQHMQIVDRYKAFRDKSRLLKRQLDDYSIPQSKRRKLHNGTEDGIMNGTEGGTEDETYFSHDNFPLLNPNSVVQINHEKCLVLLRNQRLEHFVADTLGEVTGQIYAALLDLVTTKMARCRADPLIGSQDGDQQAVATTIELYEYLQEAIKAERGIGKAPKDKFDTVSAEKVRTTSYQSESESDDEPELKPKVCRGAATSAFSNYGSSFNEFGQGIGEHPNPGRDSKVKFKDQSASESGRMECMRQHLLLLADCKYRFTRHCGTRGHGEWTVDFEQLSEKLREFELDAFIEQSFGRQGLRLTRILRERGKFDEKMLPSAALMKKSDVQVKMLAMQMAGVVDVQEVPKDNNRVANRTFFFWFFDSDRTKSQLLDDAYKTILRCMQRLQVERYKERHILSFVQRSDVKGKEEDVMTAEHYNKYIRHLELEQKLLGQLMRLDEIVAILRDY